MNFRESPECELRLNGVLGSWVAVRVNSSRIHCSPVAWDEMGFVKKPEEDDMPVIPVSRTRLLIEVAPDIEPTEVAGEERIAAGSLYCITPSGSVKARAAQGPAAPVWLMATPATTTPRAHPWDLAHDFASQPSTRATPPVQFVEPDLLQGFVYETPPESREMFRFGGRVCEPGAPSSDWPSREEFAWHLGDGFSQLASARALVGGPSGNRVRVGILDTGVDPCHSTLPLQLLFELQRDFFDDDLDAIDPGASGVGDNPGHGTATLALLAGRRVQPQGEPAFDDFLGGAVHAEVVPIRIADSVVHFFSSSMAEGIEYAVTSGCRVISISMGGVPSRRWAHAVNAAYEAGVAIFAAAGNNLRDGLPTRKTVWPARFNRVVGVCGATATKDPYFKSGFNGMQGNFGPEDKMHTAIAAYTPNTPWAEIGCRNVVSMNGGGTSSATPQVAAAAALWCQHRPSPTNIERWQRAGAVRHALFTSADKTPPNRFKFFGQGLLCARDALEVPFDTSRPKAQKDNVWFPLLNVLTGFDELSSARRRMLEVEAAQLAASSPELIEVLPDPDVPPEQISADDRQSILEALQRHRSASSTFQEFITEASP
jgi:subtilisin family serine protease